MIKSVSQTWSWNLWSYCFWRLDADSTLVACSGKFVLDEVEEPYSFRGYTSLAKTFVILKTYCISRCAVLLYIVKNLAWILFDPSYVISTNVWLCIMGTYLHDHLRLAFDEHSATFQKKDETSQNWPFWLELYIPRKLSSWRFMNWWSLRGEARAKRYCWVCCLM